MSTNNNSFVNRFNGPSITIFVVIFLCSGLILVMAGTIIRCYCIHSQPSSSASAALAAEDARFRQMWTRYGLIVDPAGAQAAAATAAKKGGKLGPRPEFWEVEMKVPSREEEKGWVRSEKEPLLGGVVPLACTVRRKKTTTTTTTATPPPPSSSSPASTASTPNVKTKTGPFMSSPPPLVVSLAVLILPPSPFPLDPSGKTRPISFASDADELEEEELPEFDIGVIDVTGVGEGWETLLNPKQGSC